MSLVFIQHSSDLNIFLQHHHYKLNRHPTLSDAHQILGIAHAAALLTLPAVPAWEVLAQTLPVFSAKPCTFPPSWWHSGIPHVHMAAVDSPTPFPLSQNGLQSQTQACSKFDSAFDCREPYCIPFKLIITGLQRSTCLLPPAHCQLSHSGTGLL